MSQVRQRSDTVHEERWEQGVCEVYKGEEMIDEVSVPALMARISELEILVTAWQSQAQSANDMLGMVRRELANEKYYHRELQKRLDEVRSQKDREIEMLMEQITPAGVPPEAASNVVSLTEVVFKRLNNLTPPTFCPQCGMIMDPQCGARCMACGFKSSCSMEPT